MKIIKILPYNIYGSRKDTYNRVCDLLNQNIDPPSLHKGVLDCENIRTYTSNLNRATECINESTTKSLTRSSLLNEIPFSLKKYCLKSNYLKNGSMAVRKVFVRAFIENNLDIPHSQLQSELQQIMKLRQNTTSVLCVSHTFRMKLIEIYSEIGDKLFENPKIIENYINPKQHMFNFGDTLEL